MRITHWTVLFVSPEEAFLDMGSRQDSGMCFCSSADARTSVTEGRNAADKNYGELRLRASDGARNYPIVTGDQIQIRVTEKEMQCRERAGSELWGPQVTDVAL